MQAFAALNTITSDSFDVGWSFSHIRYIFRKNGSCSCMVH